METSPQRFERLGSIRLFIRAAAAGMRKSCRGRLLTRDFPDRPCNRKTSGHRWRAQQLPVLPLINAPVAAYVRPRGWVQLRPRWSNLRLLPPPTDPLFEFSYLPERKVELRAVWSNS